MSEGEIPGKSKKRIQLDMGERDVTLLKLIAEELGSVGYSETIRRTLRTQHRIIQAMRGGSSKKHLIIRDDETGSEIELMIL